MGIQVVNEPPPEEGSESGQTRRDVLVKGAAGLGVLAGGPLLAACGGSASSSSSGSSASGGSSGGAQKLRVIGIGVDQNPALKAQAKKDLNIDLEYTITDTPTTTQKSITQPQNFDVGHLYVHQIPQLLPAGVTQPVDTSKIAPSSQPTNLSASAPGFQDPKLIPGIAPVLTMGKLTHQGTYGVGDAAYRMLPLNTSDPSKLTAGAPFDAATAQTVKTSAMLSGMPGVFNSDSIGYDKTVIPHVDSWAELFNPQYKGKVALINDPQIGPIDAALAAQASGKLKFGNIGNMTKGEIDNLTKLLIDMKKSGFFRAFWATFTESVNLMAEGEVVIESMWSPAQTVLLEQGKDVGFAAPKEGFRGWCGCTMIYKAEWDYWYGGKPAAQNLVGPDGKQAIPKGAIREGGSFTQRIRLYSAWNTTQPQNDYMGTQWNNFISA
jgi:putative spermidine/putrescine transport system substrate-binding protein